MATKPVSIRFSTEGGKVVIHELQQIGAVGSKSMGDLEKESRRSAIAMQNASYQVQDFFVQIAGGTDPMRAMSQQLPQLLGGIGLMGAVAGTAVAGLSVLWSTLGDTSEGAKDVTGALDEMEAAFSAYMGYAALAAQDTAELTEKFGEFAAQVREFSGYMQDVQLGGVLEANKDVIDTALKNMEGVRQAVENVAMMQAQLSAIDQGENPSLWLNAKEALDIYQEALDEATDALGLTADEAMQLYEAMEAVKAADGMAETARLAGEALVVFQELVPLGYELPEPLREAVGALEAMSRNAAEAAVVTETASLSMQDFESAAANSIAWVSQLTGETDGLAGAAAQAAQNMWDFLGAKGAAARGAYAEAVGAGRGLGPGGPSAEDLDPYGFRAQLARDGRRAPARATGGVRRGSGGGGGQSAELREAERLFEATRTEAEQYAAAVEQIDMLLGKGLITQDTYNRALDQAGEKYLDLGDAAKFWEDINQSLKDSILDLGEEGSGAFDDIARSIKRAALEALLFKSGPLAGVFGGGGAGGGGFGAFVSSLLSFEGGGYTGDGPRSGGLDGRGGFLAINHPRETITDHMAIGQGGGTGGMRVQVEAVPNPYFDVRVAQVSALGDQRAAQAQRRAMPRVLRDQQARGL